MVHLEAITEDNFQACLNLDAGLSQQQGFVDSVTYSLAEAWLNRDFQPWALYQEDDLIGFVSLLRGKTNFASRTLRKQSSLCFLARFGFSSINFH